MIKIVYFDEVSALGYLDASAASKRILGKTLSNMILIDDLTKAGSNPR